MKILSIIGRRIGMVRVVSHLLLALLFCGLAQTQVSAQGYRISMGDDFGAAIDAGGNLFLWGAILPSGSQGGLAQIPGTWREVSVSRTAAGEAHILLIATDGTLWSFGLNDRGQLGVGDQQSRTSPVQIDNRTDWIAVAAGSKHSLALYDNDGDGDGLVFAWGDNTFGQLNLEVSNNPALDIEKEVPDEPIDSNTYISIASGNTHNHAIRSDRTLWTWGSSNGGPELGILVDGDRTPLGPVELTRVGSLTGWQRLFGGFSITYATRNAWFSPGRLYAWGTGAYLGNGQSGSNFKTPTRIGSDNNWAFISRSTAQGGIPHVIALKTDGSLYGWGSNGEGQLGLPIYDGNGTLNYPENLFRTSPTRLEFPNDYLAVGAGDGFTVIIREDGLVQTAGRNDLGQLANGTIDTTPADGQDFFANTQLGRPDLVAEEVAVTSEFAGISSGDLITFTVRLSNNGTGPVDFGPGGSEIPYLGLVDAELVPIDANSLAASQPLSNLNYLPAVPASTTLGPSAELVLTLQGEVPAGISVGEFQLEVTVDADDLVDESNESNNLARSAEGAPVIFTVDLAPVGALAVIAANPVVDTFTVSFGLQNLGTGDFKVLEQEAFNLRFFLTPDFDDLSEDNILELTPVGGSAALLIDEDLTAGGGSSYTPASPIEFALPAGVEAIRYYVGMRIDSGDVIAESNETNNVQLTATKVIQVGAIDLDVALDEESRVFTTSGNADWYGFEFAGAEGGEDAAYSPQLAAGQQASFRTIVANASVISFKWRASTSGAGDFLQLNAGAQVLTLSGETEWQDVSVTVGANTNVVWTYFAGSGGPGEQVFVDDFDIAPISGPDVFVPATLLLDDSFSPIDGVSLIAGIDSFRLAYELKNQGDNLNAPGFDVAIYLSRDSNLDASEDTLVDSYNYMNAMPSGFSDTIVREYSLTTEEQSQLFGDYYIIIQVSGVTGESVAAQANNIVVSQTPFVNVQPLPDLTLKDLAINNGLRNVFFPGNQISIAYDLLNAGYGDAFGVINLRLVLSEDEVYNPGSDFTIGEAIYFGGIAAGTPLIPNEQSAGFTLFDFPADIPIGDFKYIGLVVDSAEAFLESDETNNAVFSANPVYAFGQMDLAIALDESDSEIGYDVIVPDFPFSTGFPFFGQTAESNDGIDAGRSAVIEDGESSFFDVVVDVQAGQDAIANFLWKVSSEDDGAGKSDELVLYLKRDVVGEPSGVFEEQQTLSGEVDWLAEYLLLPGDDTQLTTYTLRWSYEKDGSVAGGDDFAWVDQVSIRTLVQPDFLPDNIFLIDAGGSVIDSGQFRITQDLLSLNYTFSNIGQDYVSAGPNPLKLSFFLSQDVNLDPGTDILLGSEDDAPLGFVNLDSGGSISGSLTFDLDSPLLTPGFYYLIAVADPDENIAESDEDNNLAVTAIRAVELVAEADLAIEFDDLDSLAGGLILRSAPIGEVALTVENLGAGSVSEDHAIAFLLEDGLGLADDILLREFTSPENLTGASGSAPTYPFVRTIDAVGPAAPLGRLLNLVGAVDFRNDIPESDETNNLTPNAQTAPFIFAELDLWRALNPDLLDPLNAPSGFSGTESIELINDETAPFEGDLPFVGLLESSPVSDDLARSVALGSGQDASFSIDVSLDAPAALAFIRKADDLNTEGFTETLSGEFSVQLDAALIDGIPSLTTESDWSEELFIPIPSGDHTVTWSFERADDVPEEGFEVFAYIDGIRFLPDLQIQLDSVENPNGPILDFSPSDEVEITVLLENTNLGSVPEGVEYEIEVRMSLDEEWSDDDFVMEFTSTPAELPALGAGEPPLSIELSATVPEAAPLGSYFLLLRVDPGPAENSQVVNGIGKVREFDEDNNDAIGTLAQQLTVTALSIEEALDIDPLGFNDAEYRAVFPEVSLDRRVQTGDASWATSPDIEVKEFSDKWFAAAGVTDAQGGEDAIRTSELEAGSAASLLFRLDQPRLVSFRVQPNTASSANYLFFGANGNAIRPEGNLPERISGSSTDWETRYYIVPAEAPLGFTYVQGTTPDPLDPEFVYVDELIIGDPIDKPDYVIDTLQYDAGSYVLERDRLFVVVTGSNRGLGQPLNPDIIVRVWLSTNDAWDVGDTLLGDLDQFQELDGGTRFSYQASLILPENLPEGDYFLIARVDADTSVNPFGAVEEFAVDASNGNLIAEPAPFTPNDNNFLISNANDIFVDRRADLRIVPSEDSVFNEVQVFGPAAKSDEEVVDFFVKKPSDYVIPNGDFAEGPSELLLKFDLLNEGLSGVSAADGDDFEINVYAASSRDQLPSPDRLITAIPVEDGIAAGSRRTFEVTTSIPDNIDAGSFYYLNIVVDGTGVIDESDEDDNTTFSPHRNVFVSDVSLEVALNDEDFFDEDSNSFTHIWDKSFSVPTFNDSTTQAPFFGTTNLTDIGQDNSDSGVRASAQSGPVPAGGVSWLQKTVDVTGGDLQVSFLWKVSSQFEIIDGELRQDILEFSIRYEGDDDFTQIAFISGERDWQEFIFNITRAGTHSLRWSYIENGDGLRGGRDAGWIDDYSESSYDFVPTFEPITGNFIAGDNFPLPVYVWNLGELRIPDIGIETALRLTPSNEGDTNNLDWTVPNASDVILQESTQRYNSLTIDELVALQDSMNASELLVSASTPYEVLNDRMDRGILDLLIAEEEETEPELDPLTTDTLKAVLTSGSWLDYSVPQLEAILAVGGTPSEIASRKRFIPVRTYGEDLSIPNLLSLGGLYYLGAWANPAGAISESNFSNNLLFSETALIQLDISRSIPDALDRFSPDPLSAPQDWTLTGAGRWFPVEEDPLINAVNDDSLRSPQDEMPEGGEASISALIEGPLLLRFRWRADFGTSEDVASFYVNNSLVSREADGPAGTSMSINSNDNGSGWIEEQYFLPAGLNQIRWTYARVNDDLPQGAVFLDNIRFEDTSGNADLAISNINYSSGTYALERDQFPITVTVLNRGSLPSGPYYNDLDLELRLGNSTDFDGASQIIGNLSVVNVLDEGQRLIFQGDVDLPENLEPGTYYLLARVSSLDPDFVEFTYDTSQELLSNNDFASQQNVTIQRLPELIVRTNNVENEKIFYPKETIRFAWELENVGLGDIPFGTELTQTVQLYSVDVNEQFPSISNSTFVLNVGAVTEVTALPGRLTADDPSQSTIQYEEVFRLPSQAELLGALNSQLAGKEDLDVDIIEALGDLAGLRFFFVLTRDNTIEQSSNLNLVAVTSELFRIAPFAYDPAVQNPGVVVDNTLIDYDTLQGIIPSWLDSVGVASPTGTWNENFGGGDFENLYYYAFNLPLLANLSGASPRVERRTVDSSGTPRDETGYYLTRTVELDSGIRKIEQALGTHTDVAVAAGTYRAITFPIIRGATDLIYRIQTSVDGGDTWNDHLDIQPPYLDDLLGYAGASTLTDVNVYDGPDALPSDNFISLIEEDARIVSVIDNNYTATVTVRADAPATTESMRVVVVPLGLSASEQFLIDVFTALGVYNYQGNGILPLADFDGDGISNIAELQLGFDPTDDTDPVATPSPLELYVAEQMAELGVLGTLELDNSVTPPTGIAPDEFYDGADNPGAPGTSTFNNATELLAGSDPTDDQSEPDSPSLELSVALAWLASGTFDTQGPVSNFLPYEDFDGDGLNNVNEFVLAGRDPADGADAGTTPDLEIFVASVFTDPVPNGSIIPDVEGEGYALFGNPLNNIGPLLDYDNDGTSNIAEILLGRNPSLNNDAGIISNLQEFTAEGFALLDVYSLPAPLNIGPNSNFDGDLVNNALELMLGSDPTDATSGPATNTLAYFVAEQLVIGNAFSDYPVSNFGPFDDLDGDGFSNASELLLFVLPYNPASQPSSLVDAYTADAFAALNEFAPSLDYNAVDDFDGDGTSNIAELQLGRDPSSGADINSTTLAADVVAEAFALEYGLFNPTPALIGPNDDFDSDMVSNIAEIQAGTDPTNPFDVPASELDVGILEAFAAAGVIVGEVFNGEIVVLADLDPTADFDEDGETNILEYALGGLVADLNVQVEPINPSMSLVPNPALTLTFVRLKASATPADLEITLECSTIANGAGGPYNPVDPGDIVSDVPSADQTNLPSSDYERVDVTIDTTGSNCGFFRVSVQQTP